MYHAYLIVMLKKRKTMAVYTLLVGVTLLFLTMAVHQNHGNETDGDAEPYFVNSYKCVNNTCVISKIASAVKEYDNINGSLDVCRLTCGPYGSLWPKPTVKTVIGNSVVDFALQNIKFDVSSVVDQLSKDYLTEAYEVFVSSLKKLCVPNCESNHATFPTISISTRTSFEYIKLTTNESYDIKITFQGDQLSVKINAITVYGARHGLETLRQLIATYGSNTLGRKLVMASDVQITDWPTYAYRGFMLDTARHYFPISTIKRQIDAMGHSKLNVFHWHVTDSHSFPLDLPSAPKMSKYGAYSPEEKYSYNEIKELLRYALVRGVRIVIEIDSPAHAGNGWQWGKSHGYGDMALCVDKGPWQKYCIQPPCGQLNPINTNTYKWLGKIYKDLINILPKGEMFHMGGDEVAINCWNSTDEIVNWMKANNYSLDENGYFNLWAKFHANSLSEYDKEAGNVNSDIIIWNSGLTEPDIIEKYIDKNRYTIETWDGRTTSVELVKLGYKVIIALKDIYYLDHGFWGTTSYHNWKLIYNNKMPSVENTNLLLGAETCMWSEYVDEHGVDSRVWPRAAALAERLWTNPTTQAIAAEYRLLQHRERLVSLGLDADTIVPEWCYLHDGECLL